MDGTRELLSHAPSDTLFPLAYARREETETPAFPESLENRDKPASLLSILDSLRTGWYEVRHRECVPAHSDGEVAGLDSRAKITTRGI